ncbi:RidA family protein [Pseudomonas sp. CCM 7891]|uniref:RidA family protein n=1 Tax=Pseudomonas karstica TaxID=1055468 RepID=A0A7X2UZQ6_9PSED|nr:Rid family detoxifying hydrolase [Pseudomonas karstica]MTD20773.1 RidA family protein [Pseudomonas karstica]
MFKTDVPLIAFGISSTIKRYWPVSTALAIALAVHSSFSAASPQHAEQRNLVTANAPTAIGPYAQAVRAGETLYLSGQLPIDPASGAFLADAPIEVQTSRVLDNIQAVLAADGLEMRDIVSTTVYLKDLNDFTKMNEVYASYFKQSPPARVTVQVSRLPKDSAIEISSIAQRR